MMSVPPLGAIKEALGMCVGRVPRLFFGALVGCILLIFFVSTFFCAPFGFPKGALIEIPEDASFGEAALMLEGKGIVGSSFWLRALARITGTDREIHAGRYLFETPQGLVPVLMRLANGDHGLPSVRVTFPEGTSVREMGTILREHIAGFDEGAWNARARSEEGYLFPDTYDFYKDATFEEIMTRMRENFDMRTKDLRAQAEAMQVPFEDIITMASIIEKEANTEADRHIVSGILWSRIEEGVALQVDAVFPYILNDPDHIPHGDDTDLDSPYNTYQNRGLPPGPITNPGLDAIDAAVHPKATDYFYYLTGKDGVMYYAATFEEHKRNRERFLD